MARASGSAELDLQSFSDEELHQLINNATAVLDERIRSRIEEFRPLARRAGYELTLRKFERDTAGERRGRRRSAAGDRRSAIAPKYRNPDNPAETWSGRGRKPVWLERELEKGRQLSVFAIGSSQTA